MFDSRRVNSLYSMTFPLQSHFSSLDCCLIFSLISIPIDKRSPPRFLWISHIKSPYKSIWLYMLGRKSLWNPMKSTMFLQKKPEFLGGPRGSPVPPRHSYPSSRSSPRHVEAPGQAIAASWAKCLASWHDNPHVMWIPLAIIYIIVSNAYIYIYLFIIYLILVIYLFIHIYHCMHMCVCA